MLKKSSSIFISAIFLLAPCTATVKTAAIRVIFGNRIDGPKPNTLRNVSFQLLLLLYTVCGGVYASMAQLSLSALSEIY